MASFGSVRDATMAWDATSHEGNEAVLDSRWATTRVAGWATARVAGWATARVAGWATARVAPTRASSPSCSGVGATLVVAHACRRPMLVVAHAIAPAGRAVAHAGFPGMASFGSVRDATRAWDATSHEGNECRAGFGMGDREGRPYAATSRVAGCSTARVAPDGRPHAGFPGWATRSRVAGRDDRVEGRVAGWPPRMGDRKGRGDGRPQGSRRWATSPPRGPRRRAVRV